jgi:hypothetical protein
VARKKRRGPKRKTRPKPENRSRRKRDLDVRFMKAEGIYLRDGNAYQAMLSAGYSEKTARSNCSQFKDRIYVRLCRVLKARELDEWRVARKYEQLLDAKAVKFQPKTGEPWYLEDSDIQLRTANEIRRIIEPDAPAVQNSPGGSASALAATNTVVLVTCCPRPDRSKQNVKRIAKDEALGTMRLPRRVKAKHHVPESGLSYHHPKMLHERLEV